MDRRNFLRSLIGGVATAAAVRTWPFRMYSFPSEIKIARPELLCVSGINPDAFDVGQMIAMYSSSGELRGDYKVEAIDEVGRFMFVRPRFDPLPEWQNLKRHA